MGNSDNFEFLVVLVDVVGTDGADGAAVVRALFLLAASDVPGTAIPEPEASLELVERARLVEEPMDALDRERVRRRALPAFSLLSAGSAAGSTVSLVLFSEVLRLFLDAFAEVVAVSVSVLRIFLASVRFSSTNLSRICVRSNSFLILVISVSNSDSARVILST